MHEWFCACMLADAERLRTQDFALRTHDRPVSSSTGYPLSTQASNPPASGRTTVNPRSISMRATRAAEASLGQVQ
jgi:hypothetical protein